MEPLILRQNIEFSGNGPLFLSENRRSTQQILDYSKKYFLDRTSNKKQYEKELQKFKSADSGSIPQIIATNAKMKKILTIINKNPKKYKFDSIGLGTLRL